MRQFIIYLEHTLLTQQCLYSYRASFSSTGKKVTEPTWNIYVLQKKDAVSMHQQFVSNLEHSLSI